MVETQVGRMPRGRASSAAAQPRARRSRPKLIITMGPTGSGKDTLMKIAAKHTGARDYQRALIDDVVENNAYYKSQVKKIAKHHCPAPATYSECFDDPSDATVAARNGKLDHVALRFRDSHHKGLWHKASHLPVCSNRKRQVRAHDRVQAALLVHVVCVARVLFARFVRAFCSRLLFAPFIRAFLQRCACCSGWATAPQPRLRSARSTNLPASAAPLRLRRKQPRRAPAPENTRAGALSWT